MVLVHISKLHKSEGGIDYHPILSWIIRLALLSLSRTNLLLSCPLT
ncbi:hypothetical protein ACOMICROBIO_GDFFDHBD_04233 [Vibrio sp. B1REV9]|nr:hypothetical protein ACOMICROBIO_GDFFDHBD_04233 [Vibrio sp. B1REV9]